MNKILITSGCSFSECFHKFLDTWPRHLARLFPEYEHKSYAMGSQGNGLISRSIIYAVSEALKTHKPEDILVGVMWSGLSRVDYRMAPEHINFENNIDGWMTNPTKFMKEHDEVKNAWVILNSHWKIKEAQVYYSTFFDDIGASIYSIEHILRTQWFLKINNIKYFFTDFTNENIVYDENMSHPEIKYLYDQIDRTQYLPVRSQHDWLCDNSKFLHQWSPEKISKKYPIHPTTDQHKEFTDNVIYPWLKERYFK